MKIGVSSYSFRKYMLTTGASYVDICDKAKELGFEGIEFVPFTDCDPLEMAKTVRAHCEKIGLPIIAYTVGANFLADDIEAEIARVKGCVDVCEALGAPLMRHDVASKLRPVHMYSYEDAISEMAPRIREVTEYAEMKGIRTCSENHGFIFQSPERVEELILAVGHKNYGWLCDMGNFLCVDVDPVEAVYVAAPYAFHVHAKDFLFKPGNDVAPVGFGLVTGGGNYLRGTVVGHGIVPVRQCVNILKRAGYDAWLSLEFEGLEDNITALEQGLAYLKSCV